MGNLESTMIYAPKDLSRDPKIISLLSSFYLVSQDDILRIINKKLIPKNNRTHPLSIIRRDIGTSITESSEHRTSCDWARRHSELLRKNPDSLSCAVKYSNPDAHKSGCPVSPCLHLMKPSRRDKHFTTCSICPRYYVAYIAWCDSNRANIGETRRLYQQASDEFSNETKQVELDAIHDRDHDLAILENLLQELESYVKSTILISPETAEKTITLESDLDVSVKVEDVMRLVAYNTGLVVATDEFEKHLSQVEKRE